MAFGQKQVAIAFPQPNTSNGPVAARVRVGGGFLGLFPTFRTLPPFNPVRFTVAETNAAAIDAITLQLSALLASINTQFGTTDVPETVVGTLAEINSNLTRIADQKAALASSLNKLTISVGSYTANLNQQTQIMSTQAANQIQYNNFHRAYSGEKPDLPDLKQQLEQAVKEGIGLNDQAGKVGFITTSINGGVGKTVQWIQGTEVYQTISNYLNKVKDSILAVLPPSLKSTASQAKTGRAPQ